jgi:heptosyltransferase I
MPRPDNILIIRLSSLGDVLMSIPAVAAVRSHFAGTRITWLVEGSVSDFLACQGFVDRVIRFPRASLERALKRGDLARLFKELRTFLGELRITRYDLVLDFHGILKSALLSLAAGGGKRIGFGQAFAKEQSHLFYHDEVNSDVRRLHKVERNLLIPRSLGWQDSHPEIQLAVPRAADTYMDDFFARASVTSPVFAINPFSSKGSTFKRWDLERYGKLVRKIKDELAAQVIVLWGPGEQGEAARLRDMTGGAALLCCPTTVPQLFALFKRVDMYIGGDTGLMHLAALAGTPVVAIFGPTDHKINGPYGTGNVIVRKDVPCSPCKNKDCGDRRCLTEITVEEVFQAVHSACNSPKDNLDENPFRLSQH